MDERERKREILRRWRRNNPERDRELKERHYYKDLQHKKEKAECPLCGSEVSRSYLSAHKKTQKCFFLSTERQIL